MLRTVRCQGKDVPFGAYIETDLLSDNGVLLLKKGTFIDSRVRDILNRYQGLVVCQVDVSDKVVEEVDIGASVEDDNALVLDNDIKERVLQGVDYMYSNPGSEDSVIAAKDTAETLLGVVADSSSINISLNNLKVCDDYTFRHCVDVATMGVLVGQKLGMSKKDMNAIAVAGIMHDIGKTQIPDSILNKPGKLTDEEFKIMQQHTVYGYNLVKDNHELDEKSKLGILMHHEKCDGTGYPFRLPSEKINIIGKLLGVVDVYDALVTKRPYRNDIIEPASALEMMFGMSPQFDIEIFRTFLNCVVIYPIGTNIMLSNGGVYRVVAQNIGYPLRPVVRDVITQETLDLLHDTKCLSLTISGGISEE